MTSFFGMNGAFTAHAGAHGEDEVLRGERLRLAVLRYIDGVRILERGKALDMLDPVLFEEHPDAAALGGHDLVLARHNRAKIGGDRSLHLYAQLVGRLHLMQPIDAGDEGLAGNASPVQTGSPKELLFNTDDSSAKLCGPDCGHVTARPGADYNHVCIEIIIRH
jgi:hypothetical protein